MEELNEKNILQWIRDKFRRVKDKIKINYIKPGGFYNMKYQAKGYEKGTLPYFDKTPMILALENRPRHILGINFNYIPIKNKQMLIKRLKRRYPRQWGANKLLPNLKFKNVMKELEYMDFMVKLYIKDRIGQAVTVETQDMEKVAKIDLSSFLGTKVDVVWRQYKKGLTK